ncbi:GspE/PulE family protein [Jannaschia aquimarina]|uniref:EpsE protein n=1 Tax=Jannaschia aquimarina TaxID=935700 RepID=A0A0D1CM91_9RHOB|nr:GspE/PulE family protein [Jannaschia aquimarina]KIT15867.1 Type II secretion system protein E [Jannaschia aquimarina]SNT10380.1 type II secretion system protein E (GspE) [Jannaschia aquimarina]
MSRVVTVHLEDVEIPQRLLAEGRLTPADVAKVRHLSSSSGQPVRLVLDRLGLVSQTDWAGIMAQDHDLPLLALDDFPVRLPKDDRLSSEYMRRNGIALLEAAADGAAPLIAIANPLARRVRQALAMIYGPGIRYAVATDRDIETALDRSASAEEAAPEEVLSIALSDGDLDADRLTELANNAPTVRYLDRLFAQAVEAGATDIHLEMLEGGPRIRLRLDGILSETAAMERHLYEGVVSRLKILAGMDISERRLPQDGRIRQQIAGRRIDIRVASAPTVLGETLVLRLLDNAQKRASLGGLHLPGAVAARLRQALRQPNGLILMTGPTGSGKTTTLHAALAELNEIGRKIVTIENPVEIQTAGLVQIEVKAELGWTFAAALRTVLRHDPDVIMVGEIRDAETAELAVRAALTGHLVLSTLHTNRATEAVMRLTDMGVPDYLLTSVLRVVGAQRLVRTLCDCAAPVDLARRPRLRTLLAKFAAVDPSLGPVERWSPRLPTGCPRCNRTGYAGRAALFEVATEDGAGVQGGRTLGLEGLALLASGRTTLEELVRVLGAGRFWI